MAIQEKLYQSQMENLITLLCFSDEYGKILAHIINVNLFTGDYGVIADRALSFWRRENTAPKAHTIDLCSDIVEDKHDRRGPTYRRIISQMEMTFDSGGLSPQHVINTYNQFVYKQDLSVGILQASRLLSSPNEESIEEVSEIIHTLDKAILIKFDPGLSLDNVDNVINYLESHYYEFDTGIPLLDKRGVVPRRGTLFMLVGAKGAGKSFWLIHLGKRALMQRKKVLHITIENSRDETQLRYLQAMFSIARREGEQKIAVIATDEGQISSISYEDVQPEFDFTSPELRIELESRIRIFGDRMRNLRIQKYAPRVLTPSILESYLDSLAQAENFIPDLLIVDYPQIMKIDTRDFRLHLGRTMEEIRGIAVTRDMAVCAVHQSSREGADAVMVRETHVAEDWSVVQTSDTVATLSKTKAEKKRGLARLYVTNARTEKDDFGVLITQNYAHGQFLLESYPLMYNYSDMLEGFNRQDRGEQNDGDESTAGSEG